MYINETQKRLLDALNQRKYLKRVWLRGGRVMKVSELKEYLSKFNDDEKITFYFLKNDTLTNCQVEDINSYGMGIEFTIQDTSELFEEAA